MCFAVCPDLIALESAQILQHQSIYILLKRIKTLDLIVNTTLYQLLTVKDDRFSCQKSAIVTSYQEKVDREDG